MTQDRPATLSSIKDLGAAVRSARKAMHLRQAEAAALCDVGVRFLSDLENGKDTVRLGTALKVLNGLGLALSIGARQPSWKANG
jgi:HTH-type transcriptional regulator / antitoxin HipB